mmetsp:Transcript_1341/g.2007  ORF Transcript_1341/g.2007 Transcript_1341/m.2007 type:complete len:200 (+) Transcript_1341:1270-1869(+)
MSCIIMSCKSMYPVIPYIFPIVCASTISAIIGIIDANTVTPLVSSRFPVVAIFAGRNTNDSVDSCINHSVFAYFLIFLKHTVILYMSMVANDTSDDMKKISSTYHLFPLTYLNTMNISNNIPNDVAKNNNTIADDLNSSVSSCIPINFSTALLVFCFPFFIFSGIFFMTIPTFSFFVVFFIIVVSFLYIFELFKLCMDV